MDNFRKWRFLVASLLLLLVFYFFSYTGYRDQLRNFGYESNTFTAIDSLQIVPLVNGSGYRCEEGFSECFYSRVSPWWDNSYNFRYFDITLLRTLFTFFWLFLLPFAVFFFFIVRKKRQKTLLIVSLLLSLVLLHLSWFGLSKGVCANISLYEKAPPPIIEVDNGEKYPFLYNLSLISESELRTFYQENNVLSVHGDGEGSLVVEKAPRAISKVSYLRQLCTLSFNDEDLVFQDTFFPPIRPMTIFFGGAILSMIAILFVASKRMEE